MTGIITCWLKRNFVKGKGYNNENYKFMTKTISLEETPRGKNPPLNLRSLNGDSEASWSLRAYVVACVPPKARDAIEIRLFLEIKILASGCVNEQAASRASERTPSRFGRVTSKTRFFGSVPYVIFDGQLQDESGRTRGTDARPDVYTARVFSLFFFLKQKSCSAVRSKFVLSSGTS